MTSLPSATLTVAAVQADPVPGDVAGNASSAARLVRRAVDSAARLVVLPELFLPATLDPEQLARTRADHPMLVDRLPDQGPERNLVAG
ncbi:nitrilase-related carbon-nitrogen hydrolase [Micromonospora inyonensis]|uniref:Carbon-nitrogen hydrolase n=1 Tax=Micromonospora inyonensis TaxID=47866 RepID=A0A1C6S477_9ACTN|nr:nitrilase-related carbon-nitrogen hydrolase [Micromonospora inyonensis]SCL24273.1 Carbon-nitrogen hydrolase [Micromonospora inyonensis]